ncbi:MAG: hypothetical protein LBU65_11895 [Planctomycetaceae bacterium]|jgi:hypothetical protein|nr:hypothetical protein [Planctomycetaceae bacterium]
MSERSYYSSPAGYAFLIARFHLNVIPNWHQSFIADGNTHRVNVADGVTEEIFPHRYKPASDSVGEQLEFALKYDGTNLAIIAAVFRVAPQGELEEYVASKPNANVKYSKS